MNYMITKFLRVYRIINYKNTDKNTVRWFCGPNTKYFHTINKMCVADIDWSWISWAL